MYCNAAILFEHNKPLIVGKIKLPPLKEGQVLVKIAYSGICQSQLLEINGSKDNKKYLPHCLGHEASGIVVDIGENVKKVKPDDRVVLTWIQGTGMNVPGSFFEYNDMKINAGPITTFSEYTIVSENRLYHLKTNISLQDAALLGCAIPTGLGAVFNVAKPQKNQSIVVFGCGGIGLLAIQGAKILGCNPIIAVDLFDNKLKMAKEMGATQLIKVNDYQKNKIENKLDFAIEASGNVNAMINAIESVKPRGGIAVIVGNIHHKEVIQINPKHFNMGKSILGTWGGNSHPDKNYFDYEKLIYENKLDLSIFNSKTYQLNDINEALEDFKNGNIARVFLKMY
jgi:S-(hydroxymethyl)glutathione dehydrogenase/alcohol dehydrogenase